VAEQAGVASGPPYCHCKLQFADDVSCSIYMGTNAGMRTRSFDASSYDCVVVPCSAKQHTAMYTAATSMVAQQVQFSTLKMTACMLWVPVADDVRFMFCSKMCADILQSVQVLEALTDTGKVTPSSLCRMLQSRPPPVSSCRRGPRWRWTSGEDRGSTCLHIKDVWWHGHDGCKSLSCFERTTRSKNYSEAKAGQVSCNTKEDTQRRRKTTDAERCQSCRIQEITLP